MPQAMTITPDGFTSEETGEFIQTGHTVEGSQEQLRTDETRHQVERFETDPDTGETSYNNDITEQEYQHIIESYGGEEVYADVTAWAEQNFSPDDIAGFNAIVDGADINEIASAVDQVYRLYENRNSDAEQPTQETEVEDSDANFVFNEVIPQHEYQQLVEFASQTFDDEFLEQYNSIMESGDRNMITKTIKLLQTKFNEN